MGGGEKVLYTMIDAVFRSLSTFNSAGGKNIRIAIYSAANASSFQVMAKVKVIT